MIAFAARLVMLPALLQSYAGSARTPALAARDSARLVREARSAQRDFESFRRSRLPRGESHPTPCDVTIGRYCYWRGEADGEDHLPPPEPAPIRERRVRLISLLDSTAALLPGDAWVVGQLMRYHVEARSDSSRSLPAVERCRAPAAWCGALAGYVAHARGAYAAADSAYARALASMSEDERCRWLDISRSADDDVVNGYDKLPCAERAAFTRRLLTVSAPLYLMGGTDLYTEHLARVTRAFLAERAATVDGESWGDDSRELMTRYGWPDWYSRVEAPMGSMRMASITGHDPGLPYYFLPSLRAFQHPGGTTQDDWQMDDRHARSGYAPPYAKTIHTLAHQVAVFRRGDSALVLAAWDASKDTTLTRRPLEALLAITPDGLAGARTIDTAANATGRLWALAAVDSGFVSVELLARKEKRAARTRIGLAPRPAAALTLSDLLLFDAPSGVPAPDSSLVFDGSRTGPGVATWMLATDVVSVHKPVGVFWESYGLPASSAPIEFTLSVEQIGVGMIRRAAERLHLTDRSSGLRVQWTEVPILTRGIAGRGLRVDLSRLRTGRYRLALTAKTVGGLTSTTSREIALR